MSIVRKLQRQNRFRLSRKAQEQLNQAISVIREGINNVCEMHTHDSRPSIKQADFEVLYIEKLIAPLVSAVRSGINAMADGLAKQKTAEAEALKEQSVNIESPAEGKEDL